MPARANAAGESPRGRAADMRATFWRIAPSRAAPVRRALLFMLRAVAILSMSFGAAFGFLAAMRSPGAHYDPHTFAIGTAALFGAACGAIGLLISREPHAARRTARACRRSSRICSDRNWELRESEEHARSFLEAQGDVIVRTDSDGLRDLCQRRLLRARRPRARGPRRRRRSICRCSNSAPRPCSPTAAAATTRRSPSPNGARWIAWRDVPVRNGGKTEMQSVGRDVTDRVEAEQRAVGGARSGGSREPGEVALSGDDLARDPHAAQRHPRHERPACSTRR